MKTEDRKAFLDYNNRVVAYMYRKVLINNIAVLIFILIGCWLVSPWFALGVLKFENVDCSKKP